MSRIKIPFSYLKFQFHDKEVERILAAIREVAKEGDFTLGKSVFEFEEKFAELCHAKYAVAVNSGTAALSSILESVGIGRGDEVITVPNSFFATTAAIDMLGAKTVFVDVDDQYLMDVSQVEGAITSNTKAILPVHWAGCPADMTTLETIALKHNLFLFEDACQAVCAQLDGKTVGSWGIAGAISFHPLKNLNGWGDAGAVLTNHKEIAEFISKWRNHGMENRNETSFFAPNQRMNSIAAAVLNCIIDDIGHITERRIANAALYDELLSPLSPEVILPPRPKNKKHVYHLYIVRVPGCRDALQSFLAGKGVETKVHYPIPLHLQRAARHLGYKEGDFPNCEKQAKEILSLPGHQYLSEEQIRCVSECIEEFFASGRFSGSAPGF